MRLHQCRWTGRIADIGRILVGMSLIAMGTLGCYRSEVAADETIEATSDDASVYAALCRYWERCRPDRLDFFPGSDVQGCIAFYNCFYSSPFFQSTFEEAAVCRKYIEDSACDAVLSAIAIKPAATGSLLTQVADAATGNAQPGSKGVALQDIPGCDLNYPEVDTEQEPSVYPGDPCFVDPWICGEGLYCRASSPYQIVGEQFCGVCEAPQGVGGTCDETVLCESNAVCDGEICQARSTLGDSCEDDSDCIEGSCTAGICAALGSIGDACDSDNDCETDVCGKDGLCSEYTVSDLGEPCDQTEDSVPSYCDPDRALTCIDQTCAPLSDVDGPCEYSHDCRLGLICHDDLCIESACILSVGDPCDDHLFFCETGYFCDSVTDTCRSPLQEGELCETFDSCASGLFCRESSEDEDSGICTRLREDGAPCTDSGDCQNGYCARDNLDCQIYTPWYIACDMPSCDDCGVCAPEPTVSSCENP